MSSQIEQLKKIMPGVTGPSKKGWYKLPECPICHRPSKMYFHPHRGYKCWSVKCGESGSVKHFPVMMRECGYEISVFDIPRLSLKEILKKDESGPLIDRPVNVPLPPEARPFVKGRTPKCFVKERGYPKQLILDLNLHYCEAGKYKNRIIIPLRTGRSKGYFAYATKKKIQTTKTLNPEDCEISRFLFPYNYVAKQSPDIVVLVEGVTDAMRIMTHRMDSPHCGWALAMLGKNLSEHHIKALKKLFEDGLKEIVVCLDQEAEKYNYLIAKTLKGVFGGDRVAIIDLARMRPELSQKILWENPNAVAGEIDPDDIRECDTWLDVMSTRESLHFALI